MNFHTLFHPHIFPKNTNGMDQIDCRLKIIGTKLTKYTSTPKINKYIKWLQIAVLVALHSNFQSQHLRIYALWYPLEEVHLEQNSTWIGANSSSIAFQSQNLSFHALRDLWPTSTIAGGESPYISFTTATTSSDMVSIERSSPHLMTRECTCIPTFAIQLLLMAYAYKSFHESPYQHLHHFSVVIPFFDDVQRKGEEVSVSALCPLRSASASALCLRLRLHLRLWCVRARFFLLQNP